MIKRIIHIASAAHLKCKLNQLVIVSKEGKDHQVPIEDIGFLILDNTQITHSQHLLAECLSQNVAVLICDNKHLPAGLLMPLTGHTLQSKTMQRQADADRQVKYKAWQQIIQAKIQAQHHALKYCTSKAYPIFERLASQVKPDDLDNCEAQAARYYFPALFGKSFRRDRNQEGLNSLLNYGYTIIRSACARALVGAGLHPTLGIHHRNQYDSFCLADDIIEPLRPIVDVQVYQHLCESDDIILDKNTKADLVAILSQTVRIGRRKNIPLMVALEEYCASLRRMLLDNGGLLKIPSS